MKRPILLTLVGVVLATGAWADAPTLRTADEARQLHENLDLVRNLVKGGLLLAAEDDPLKRADHCNALATYLASEIEQAAERHDIDRAAELGQHLRMMLQHGVADNVRALKGDVQPGSVRDQQLGQLSKNVRQVLDTLESHLRKGGDINSDQIGLTLQAVRDGKEDVEQALRFGESE